MNTFLKTELLLIILLLPIAVVAQIETEFYHHKMKDTISIVPFFTNRVLEYNEDSTIAFKNSSTKQTNTLYFCNYNYKNDSIDLNMMAENLSEDYPTEKVEHNILYDIYERNRLEKGIKSFYIVVGGFGKSFKKQTNDYMQSLKKIWGFPLAKSGY